MLSSDAYLAAVAHRIQVGRGQVYQAPVGPVTALVGNVFDGAGPLAQMHTCVVVAGLPEVNAFIVQDFAQRASQHAAQATNGVKGFGTAVVTLVGLVSPVLRPDAVQIATQKPRMEWGGTTRPVLVDLSTGQIHTFTGTQIYGFALQRAIRGKIQTMFPPPGQVVAEQRGMPGVPQPPQVSPPQPPPMAPQSAPPGYQPAAPPPGQHPAGPPYPPAPGPPPGQYPQSAAPVQQPPPPGPFTAY